MSDFISDSISELYVCFDSLNTLLFNNELERPVITISPDSTKGAYGWCTSWQAWKDNVGQGYYEINICAEYLNRDKFDTIGTLLHEMCHLFNLQEGVQDTSRNGCYHNKRFYDTAITHGLECHQEGKNGYCRTTLDSEHNWSSLFNVIDFPIYRPAVPKSGKGSKKGNSHSIKYTCPECGCSVRATKEVRIMCADCEEMMVSE